MKKTVFLIACMFPLMFLFGQKNENKNVTSNNPTFVETYWIIKSIEGDKVEGNFDILPYIFFEKGNLYYGYTGCNTYFGKFTLKKNKLKMKYSGSTKKICKNMNVESDFLKVLKLEITHFKLEGDNLVLFVKDREVLRCKAGENPNLHIEKGQNNLETTSPTQNQDNVEKEEAKEVEEIRD